MWERVRSLWTITDLRNKLLFTLGMLFVFRILSNIPVPLTADGQQRLLDLFAGRGDAGRRKFSSITRLITVPLAFLQGIGQLSLFVQVGILDRSSFNLVGPDWLNTLAMLMTLTAGTMILVWIGELITDYGIGNGTSIIIFGGIVSTLPSAIQQDIVAVATSGGGGSSVVS